MIRIKQRQHRQWILTIDVLYERTNSFLMFISCFLVLFHFIMSSAVQTRCVEAGVLTLAKQTEWEKKHPSWLSAWLCVARFITRPLYLTNNRLDGLPQCNLAIRLLIASSTLAPDKVTISYFLLYLNIPAA